MNPLIDDFLNYMTDAKNAGENTLMAYRRDLCKLEKYLLGSGGHEIRSATSTALMAYVLHLHKNGKHASTVSRNIAVIKNFYKYLYYGRYINQDPAYLLKPPKVLRTAPPSISHVDREKLLGLAPKAEAGSRDIRDCAIAALISFTQINISVLTELNIGDVELASGLISHRNAHEMAETKLEPRVLEPLKTYIRTSRQEILKNSQPLHLSDETTPLFVSMKGQRLSRQGLWKIVKEYGRRAQLDLELSPKLLKGANKKPLDE